MINLWPDGYWYLSDMSIKGQVQSTFFSVSTGVGAKTADGWIKKYKKLFHIILAGSLGRVSFTRKDQQTSANSRCCSIQGRASYLGLKFNQGLSQSGSLTATKVKM